MTEMSLRDQLLDDYDRHEDAIEKAALVELWELGDWLADYVPPSNGGAGMHHDKVQPEPHLTVGDLAGRRGRSRQWLSDLRKVALVTRPDRLALISPRAYTEALRHNEWDIVRANASLVTKGHRLRDQTPGPMESVDAVKANLAKRTPEQRADVARELSSDPTVRELLGDQPVPDFGANWVDVPIVRIDEQAEKLARLVEREGLVFSPDSELAPFLEMLMRAERNIADVRAAVQERIRDARIEVM